MNQLPEACIPANPDISGIGVRIAIYAQNLLCFAPVVAHLWDGVVTSKEMKGIMDQSVGMLSIAFAILISTIIQATGNSNTTGGGLSSFHAAIILDLSWMNNTSTWIWFLLHIHSRSKGDEGRRVLPNWKDWIKVLHSPLQDFTRGYKTQPSSGESIEHSGVRSATESSSGHDAEGGGNEAEGEERGSLLSEENSGVEQRKGCDEKKPPKSSQNAPIVLFLQHLWNLTSRNLVLTLGSLHLSLMASIGLWLWSNPSSFGTPLGHCVPSLSVVGGPLPFSAPGLRIFSLIMYSLLVIPGINLVPPFIFFLFLHISYNDLRKNHPHLCSRISLIISPILSIPMTLWRLPRNSFAKLRSAITQIRDKVFARRRSVPPLDLETGNHSNLPSHGTDAQPLKDASPRAAHTAFVIVGFVSLVLVDIIMLIDVELTLRRNKRNQMPDEGNWGFGQVLALLLLIIPLRDFVNSFVEIRNTVKEEKRKRKQELDEAQEKFEGYLQKALRENRIEGYDFMHWIDKGADPNVRLMGVPKDMGCFELVAYVGDVKFAQYLIEQEARPNSDEMVLKEEGVDFWHHQAISHISDRLGSSESLVRLAAISALSGVLKNEAVQAKMKQAIPEITECLKDLHGNVRGAAILALSEVSKNKVFQDEMQQAITKIMEYLNDSNDFFSLVQPKKEVFQDEMQKAIPKIMEGLNDFDRDVRRAAILALSEALKNGTFQDEMGQVMSKIMECLNDSDSDVRSTAISALPEFLKSGAFQHEMQLAIPKIVECLTDSYSNVRSAALSALSEASKNGAFQDEMQQAIPKIMECLNDSYSDVRSIAISALSQVLKNGAFQGEMGQVITRPLRTRFPAEAQYE